MAKVRRLSYLGFNASDLEAWKKYGTEVLAMEVTADSTGALLKLRMDDHFQRLLFQKSSEDDVAFAGWQTRDAAEMRALATIVKDQGLKVTEGTPGECATRRVQAFVWFIDPNSGVRFELAWGPEVVWQPAFKPSRPFLGYKTGKFGIGHLAIYVKDLVAAERFYVDVMGFGLSDFAAVPQVGNVVGFFHCNARHHSLATIINPGAKRKINHLSIESVSINDVGPVIDIAKAQDMLAAPMGRHMNDHAISAYLKTPAGWVVEFASHSREIDPSDWCAEVYDITTGHGGGFGHDGVESIL